MATSTKGDDFRPYSESTNPLLNDLYQLTMAYAYWKGGRHEDPSIFELFFRKSPFKGEFCIFAGLEEVLRHVHSFKFTPEQLAYLKKTFPSWEEGYFTYLSTLDCSQLQLSSPPEGTAVFPRIPLIRVEGPLLICQLLETTLLNCCNYASLMATNACRFRIAAGKEKRLLEFGLRRAQGPDGAMSASRYSYLGGFDGTSNVLAGMMFGISIAGTHAHSFVSSYIKLEELKSPLLRHADSGEEIDLVALTLEKRKEFGWTSTNEGELTAFIAYALAFPETFLALVDTYDTLRSGVPNFLAVALALVDCGYSPRGIRLDSGDLAYLSTETRRMFKDVAEKAKLPDFVKLNIVASNDINESVLYSLNEQGHEIDTFGIGTHLVTCQAQPALGMVYKLVQINGSPRIKLSNVMSKVTIPGKKEVYRLIGADSRALVDLMICEGEEAPLPGEKVLCRHPFVETKMCYVRPTKVVKLLETQWDREKGLVKEIPSLEVLRTRVGQQSTDFRTDHLRAVNPTPYKVSVSDKLFRFVHALWLAEMPVAEFS